MYSNMINYINSLDTCSLEQFIKTQKDLPSSEERTINIGYALMKLERLEESMEFFYNELGEEFDRVKILLTGFYKWLDGNWHSYDDDLCKRDNNNNNNCCGSACAGIACIGCGVACYGDSAGALIKELCTNENLGHMCACFDCFDTCFR